jgi:hypothetical protein
MMWIWLAILTPVVARADSGSPSSDELVRLARTDPTAFLQASLAQYDRDVKGYLCTLQKQERLEGKLHRSEVIDVAFREKPFAVRLGWREGMGLAQAVLYAKGENNDKLVVRPTGLAAALVGLVERDPDGKEARQSGRYPLTQFGIRLGTERTLAAWEKARKDGTLHVEYLGTKSIYEAGNRVCYVLRRTRYASPEEEGVRELTAYFDQESLLQVGTVLKGPENRIMGSYFFRDVKLNPKFDPTTFTRDGLK